MSDETLRLKAHPQPTLVPGQAKFWLGILLDSKNYSGEARIEGGELKVRWLEDPEDGWVCQGMVPRMRAASAVLKERIESAMGVRVWVQPVVVLWMRFLERVVQSSDVVFIHGDALCDWLREGTPLVRPFDAGKLGEFLAAARSRARGTTGQRNWAVNSCAASRHGRSLVA